MKQGLNVWSQSQHIGSLTVEQGRWQFAYSDAWLKGATSFPLSPYLPLDVVQFTDSADDKRVEWFFENLLPEGGMREALARNANVATADSFGLLTRYGEESAGALSLLAADQEYPSPLDYLALSSDDLSQRIAQTHATSSLLISSDDLHMSLAGVQNKLGVVYRDGEFAIPKGAAASSHIIKPNNNNAAFEFCPANEYFCMRLAKEMGLSIADIYLLHIPDPVYVVQRFDRVISDEGINRLHQIDLCQMLNKWVGYKYESHGGITMPELLNTLNQLIQPAVARDRIIRWTLFNFIIGNNDAHAKNLAFLVDHQGIRLAPFYDLLCVQSYLPESDMAMSIADEIKPGWIEQQHWRGLAQQAGVPLSLIQDYARKYISTVTEKADSVMADEAFTQQECDFLQEKLVPVIEQRVGYLREAFSA